MLLIWRRVDARPLSELGLDPRCAAGRRWLKGALVAALMMGFIVLFGYTLVDGASWDLNTDALQAGLALVGGFIGFAIQGPAEELVFRGYFQKQFEAFTHSRWIALFLQAVLFGIAHGYQGIEACVKIACFGALYGLLAVWRGSLRPGMMAHAGGDILSGILGL